MFQLHLLLQPLCRAWSWPAEELRYLIRAAVDFRYPGEVADHEEAKEALAISERIRTLLLELLGKQRSSK